MPAAIQSSTSKVSSRNSFNFSPNVQWRPGRGQAAAFLTGQYSLLAIQCVHIGEMRMGVLIDGITAQHVGELLENVDATAEVRPACFATYKKCFEDLIFAVLFCEEVLLIAKPPELVSKEKPGAFLATKLARVIKPLIVPKDAEAKVLIQSNVNFKARVQRDLRRLRDAFSADTQYWIDLADREAHAHLGSDDTLREEKLPPSEFVFGSPHYLNHSDSLQQLVPKRFINALARTIRSRKGVTKIGQAAAQEFAQRLATTHVANYWAFDFNPTVDREKVSRIPHVTRARLRALEAGADDFKGYMARSLLPRAGTKLLRRCDSRDSVIDNLLDLRRDYREMRELNSEALTALLKGNRKKAEKLMDMIAKASPATPGASGDAHILNLSYSFLQQEVHGSLLKLPIEWVANAISRKQGVVNRFMAQADAGFEEQFKRVFTEFHSQEMSRRTFSGSR